MPDDVPLLNYRAHFQYLHDHQATTLGADMTFGEFVKYLQGAGELVDEVLDSDSYVSTVPMYNFSVPQQIKHWVDLLIVDHRMADTNVPILSGRPALLIVTKGGGYRPGTPKEGWDHATPLRTILESTWGLDLTVVDVELTMAMNNPAMSELVPIAQMERTTAEEQTVAWATMMASSPQP